MEQLQFVFKLIDRMTSPAKKIANALKSLTKEVERPRDEMGRFMKSTPSLMERFAASAKKTFRSVGAGAWSAANAMGGLLLGAVGVATGGLALGAVGVKYAVSAASFKRNMIASFGLMLGSKEQAEAVYKEIDKFADETPFEAKEVFNTFKKLKGAGLEVAAAKNMMAAIFDVASMQSAEDQGAAIKGITDALVKMKSAGKMTAESMNMISENAKGFANAEGIYEAIAKIKGVTTDAAKKLVSSGQIDWAQGMMAFKMAASKATGQKDGAVGGATKTFGSGSFEGQISTLKSRIGSLFEDINIEPIIKALTVFNQLLSDDSKEGQNLRKTINDAFGGLGEFIKTTFTPENIKMFLGVVTTLAKVAYELGSAFFTAIKPAFDAVMKPMKQVFGNAFSGTRTMELLKQIFSDLGSVLGIVVAIFVYAGALLGVAFIGIFNILKFVFTWIINGVLWVVDAIAKFVAWLTGGTVLKDIVAFGTAIVNGIWNGIKAAWAGLLKGFSALLSLLPDGVKKVLGIASPSKVMMKLGVHTGEGFQIGIEDSMPTNAISGALPVPQIPAIAGAAKTGMSSNNFEINVFATGTGDPASDRALGQAIASTVRKEMTDAWRGITLEMGAV